MNPFSLVILGVTSNLAQTKLIPALYDLAKRNLLPADFSIIGVARGKKPVQSFKSISIGFCIWTIATTTMK